MSHPDVNYVVKHLQTCINYKSKWKNGFPFTSRCLNVNYVVKYLQKCINYESTWKTRISLHIQMSECKLCDETFTQIYKLQVHMEKTDFPSHSDV